MSTENKPAKTSQQESSEKVNSSTKKPFWKKHFLKLLLLLLLVVSVAWGYFQNRSTVSQYEKRITELKETHTAELKEMKTAHIKQLTNTLILAVRSELIAENVNQVNKYFEQTLKTFDVEKVMLVDRKTSEVILSTNKKDEKTQFTNKKLVEAQEALSHTFEGHTYAAAPVMGYSSQLGVLIIQID
ncbi:hypothetical protein CW751_12235 [Brumimicrobium salinarum]|uniref:Uncharacterized protein n=1 Tax=Brumimicrobium salinarum TaxID=2058658 RepID=A0A2I0R095_9FLAO|nr:hypothetical protein [Brumimicrobium salinarum]PKR79987.1 hypothetical protein CW751_12235 [Brumimicrobium salinarum]